MSTSVQREVADDQDTICDQKEPEPTRSKHVEGTDASQPQRDALGALTAVVYSLYREHIES